MKAKTKRRLKHLVGKKKLLKKAHARKLGQSVFIGLVGACTASLAYAVSITHPTVEIGVHSPVSGQTISAPVVAVKTAPQSNVPGGPDQSGRGSWYALGLAAPDALTCASRTFPRGSHLEVTNVQNGRKVTCLVNDYGPAVWTGRVIDLSRGTFTQVANLGQGTIPVEIRRVDSPRGWVDESRNFLAVVGYASCQQHHDSSYCEAHRQD